LEHMPGLEHILIIGARTGGAESVAYQASVCAGVVG
jgi:hypothetical protein